MPYTDEELRYIYDKTRGRCRYCRKRLSLINYGRIGKRGAWEVDHGVPVSRGGTSYYRNLWPACVDCNRDKSDRTAQSYKRSMRPPSKEGCFIVTAAFFTPLATEVKQLRAFRDQTLCRHAVGRDIMRFYYQVSPPIAEQVRMHPGLARCIRVLVRVFLRLTASKAQ